MSSPKKIKHKLKKEVFVLRYCKPLINTNTYLPQLTQKFYRANLLSNFNVKESILKCPKIEPLIYYDRDASLVQQSNYALWIKQTRNYYNNLNVDELASVYQWKLNYEYLQAAMRKQYKERKTISFKIFKYSKHIAKSNSKCS